MFNFADDITTHTHIITHRVHIWRIFVTSTCLSHDKSATRIESTMEGTYH